MGRNASGKSGGAEMSRTRDPSRIPSFFGSGVDE
jgi:hypothetical protein